MASTNTGIDKQMSQQQPQYKPEEKKGVPGGCLGAMGLGFLL